MKKSLIALAVAATLVAPVAMADTSNVTVYGAANVSLDLAKSGNSGNDVGTNHVASNSSLIGFKGSEDLGGGLSAIFQVESGIDVDAGGNSLATRETFAGLKGDSWGAVKLGKLDTPYKNSTRGLDLFGDGIADNRSLMGDSVGSPFDRVANALAYVSPSMSGISLAYAHVFGAETASATTDVKGKADSFAVMYDMAPFYATVANQKTTYGTAGTG
ncbi:MAG: porin, partial [Gallionellaceae bacterium]|nr:porin [Gallionellaceae bacterium]